MSPEVELFVRTFVIGVAVAAPVGAMGVLCIHRTLEGGWRAGALTGLGIATADAIWASLAAYGVSSISNRVVAWQEPLQLVGGTLLVIMGLVSLLRGGGEPRNLSEEFGHGSLYLSALGLTLTNPMTIMAFAAVFASAGLATSGGGGAAALATLGVGLGSLAWWLALTTVVARVHHALSANSLVWVRRLSGAVIIAFGVAAVIGGLSGR